MPAASLFVEISKEVLDNLLDNSIPEKTEKAAKYGMKIFNGKFCFVVVVVHERTTATAVRNRATRRMGYLGSVSTPPHCMVLHNLLFR